ncbi:hypothetical protein GRI97_02735 [Altererythrobacter xixiisoli]|uniref:Secreted protein n=1 Tax=Croceibacterium xixiisoli TaxID=1476466 RepID=A0A6I4TPS8_9SPHN|nr:hypothetical protein [Croceibacterium xixiisoli]MXO97904.1 hypothetical protein [Croceibacterium xixiisoli]
MRKAVLVAVLAFVLPACSEEKQESVPAEDIAEQLEGAAAQSSPAAREVLEDAATEARQHERLPPADEAGGFAQEALQEAAKTPAGDASPTGPDVTQRQSPAPVGQR